VWQKERDAAAAKSTGSFGGGLRRRLVVFSRGFFRGRGPRRVRDPRLGTGIGDNLSPRALTGTGSGRSHTNGGKNVLSIPGGDSPVAIPRCSNGASKVSPHPSLVVRAFLTEIVRLHGCPSSIVSGRDHVFTSNIWRDLFKHAGVKLRMSTTFHPQTDGQSEAVNNIAMYLSCITGDRLRACLDWLPWVEYCYDTSF
jgi:hypothetical protein